MMWLRIAVIAAIIMIAVSTEARDMMTSQEALQPFSRVQYQQASVSVEPAKFTFSWTPQAVTFTATSDCSLTVWTRWSGAVTMHLYANEVLELPNLGIDSLRVYPSASGTVRIWAWRR
jgi:hypothetical protein